MFFLELSNTRTLVELFFYHDLLFDVYAVVPVLFQHSLKDTEEDIVTSLDHIFTVEPMKLTSPSTDTEVALALRVLEGCCLIHRQSTILAHQHKAIPVPYGPFVFV